MSRVPHHLRGRCVRSYVSGIQLQQRDATFSILQTGRMPAGDARRSESRPVVRLRIREDGLVSSVQCDQAVHKVT